MTLEELIPKGAILGGTCAWCGAAMECEDAEELMYCVPRGLFRRSDEPVCSIGWDESIGLLKPDTFSL
jgi:hypothetical protein